MAVGILAKCVGSPELLADQLARDPARDVLDTLIEVGGSQAGCGCRGCRAEAFARHRLEPLLDRRERGRENERGEDQGRVRRFARDTHEEGGERPDRGGIDPRQDRGQAPVHERPPDETVDVVEAIAGDRDQRGHRNRDRGCREDHPREVGQA